MTHSLGRSLSRRRYSGDSVPSSPVHSSLSSADWMSSSLIT
jgi:hypothetical protein